MQNWQKVLLDPAATISEAIQVLDREKPKIVLVVDSRRRLLGTITDGDIRRALLRGIELTASVKDAMHCDPKVVLLWEKRDVIRRKMEDLRLHQMPIVDKDMVVHGLETLKNLTEKVIHDNPVFIMAGGFGKRLKPLTDDTPKPMLKVGSKPILERIIEGFVKEGFHEFYISIHYKADMVQDYFGNGERWGVDINYVYEYEPLGTAGALGLLPDSIVKKPIIMMNGDLLTKVNYESLVEFHEEHGGLATICVKEYDIEVPYGVVHGENYCVKEIIEKPVEKFFVNAGIYVLDHELLENIDGSSYVDMPDFLEAIIQSKKKVNMFPVHEYWLDIGRLGDYEKAQDEATSS